MTQKYITMPIEDLTTPKDGRICRGPRWWAVCNGQALFYKSFTYPQTHSTKEGMEWNLTKGMYPEGTEIKFIPMAFIPHNCSDYC